MPAPTLTSAIRGRTAARNAGDEYRDPWCGTLSTSARRSTCPPSRSACPASSMSPVNSTRPAAVEARSTSDASLTAVFVSVPLTGSARGPSTSSSRPGQLSRCPAPSSTTRTPAARARSLTSSHAHSGCRDGPTATAPTPRSASTAANPPT
ncbi:hypothetical protein ADK67_45465 [Saccharothrix sp. NRRL B-16348]|nr:hypothetical protein ADK67_45465 [Saccharothrix sp. NRRL B-16348]